MPTTVYKGLSVQVAGTNPGTWGAGASTSLNTGVMEIVDRNLGGVIAKSMASGDVTLTDTEPQNAIVRLTGILTADRVLTSSCQGFYFVENLTTGSFSITVTNGVSGVVVPQGTRATLIADVTNGVRIAGQPSEFASGTKCLFFQTSAPTGWTKDTSLNNGTIRIVSGSVGADGGTANFTDVFAARTILQANLPNVTLTTTINDPGHAHANGLPATPGGGGAAGTDNGVFNNVWFGTPKQNSTTATTGITASTSLGGSGTAMDFAVKYADAIRATKA